MQTELATEMIRNKLNESPTHQVTLVFNQPIEMDVSRCRTRTANKLKVTSIFEQRGNWWYSVRKNARKGYYFSARMFEHLVDVQPYTKSNDFATFEEFKAMFDTNYVQESEIQKLWDSTSAQHGGKYCRSDFRTVSPRNRQYINEFMTKLGNINNPMKLRLTWGAYGPTGRDITISHQENSPYITFSSEFNNCDNGSYYLLVGANRIMHLEND